MRVRSLDSGHLGCGNQRQIAEAETVDNAEGNMGLSLMIDILASPGLKATSRRKDIVRTQEARWGLRLVTELGDIRDNQSLVSD